MTEASAAAQLTVIAYSVGPLDNNTYVIVDGSTNEAIVIDPSFDSAPIIDDIRARGLRVTEIVNTHAHIDHVVENARFMEEFGVGLALHPADVPFLTGLAEQAAWLGLPCPRESRPTKLLSDGDIIRIGAGTVRVVHTPGHSPGSVSLIGDGFAIVGDVLFADSVGRTDLPGGSMPDLLASINDKLLTLPDETLVYPGHGPSTTIGRERRQNPFL